MEKKTLADFANIQLLLYRNISERDIERLEKIVAGEGLTKIFEDALPDEIEDFESKFDKQTFFTTALDYYESANCDFAEDEAGRYEAYACGKLYENKFRQQVKIILPLILEIKPRK